MLVSQPVVRKRRSSQEPTPEDRAAWDILAAAWPIVSENNTLAYSKRTWCKRNKRAALELVEAGHTPQRVTALLETAYDESDRRCAYYRRITTLDGLARHWSALLAIHRDETPGAKKQTVPYLPEWQPRVAGAM